MNAYSVPGLPSAAGDADFFSWSHPFRPTAVRAPFRGAFSARASATPTRSRLLRIFLLFLETTDRRAVCPVVGDRGVDTAIVVEAKEVRVVATRRTRPPVAAGADSAEAAIAEAQTTRSRIPDGAGTAELAREVDTLVRGVVRAAEGTAFLCCLGPDAVFASVGNSPAGRTGIVNGLAGLPTGIVREGATGIIPIVIALISCNESCGMCDGIPYRSVAAV